MRFTNFKSVRQMATSLSRQVEEAGLDRRKHQVTQKAISWAKQEIDRLNHDITQTDEQIGISEELFSEGIGTSNRFPRIIIRYGRVAKSLLYVIIAGVLLECGTSAALAHWWFWWLSPIVSIVLAVAFAILAALTAKGAFSIVAVEAPRRRVRLLSYTVGAAAIASFLCLVPVILARLIMLPELLTGLCLGFLSLFLLILVGAASALRETLNQAFIVHRNLRDDLIRARRFLTDCISTWEGAMGITDQRDKEVSPAA